MARIAQTARQVARSSRKPGRLLLWFDMFTVLLGGVFFVVAWPTLHLTHQVPAAAQPFIAGLAALPVVLVRLNPALGWAISAGSALLIALAIPNQPDNHIPFQVVHILALFALLFAVAVRAQIQIVLVAWAATALLMATTMADAGDSFAEAAFGWPIAMTGLVAFGLLVRWLVLSRKALTRQAEENELERARRAILEEKARIARDLHDVVAHHMSMVVVQAQTAPYRVADVSPAARAEFESIGASAREALNEIRTMLGVLRSDGQLPEHAPQPAAADVLALLDGARRAGVAVEWTIDGALAAIPDTAGLALYRIVQESLSNATRHAPRAEVRVHLAVGSDAVELVVGNGAGEVAPKGTPGTGIAGMRARAEAIGGTLAAGPRADGGFEVRARLPLAVDDGALVSIDPAAIGLGRT
ncbi:histidine kinase [Nocardia sp. CDC159]|uniref:histidine kinase n=1 Tax=Nocardia pulmonis TaxID=2951408 RepID=A0A9X2EE94_9NOCA|nr:MULTISPECIES: histidine kinase [Nocardia]MCM6776551.1 histidine kinase [Nocardia pulmonis]MCM6788975.1 histidine kinase [Nocardia sp. CDC159]